MTDWDEIIDCEGLLCPLPVLRAPVLEYRHDLYSFAAITDVSIAGFASAPYLGTTSTSSPPVGPLPAAWPTPMHLIAWWRTASRKADARWLT